MKKSILSPLVLFVLSHFIILSLSSAQAPRVGREVNDTETKEVGRGAAAKYLSKDSENSNSSRSGSDYGNYLTILAGPYMNSASYNWKGSDKRTGIAKNCYGVTYLLDQWHNIDVNVRGDFTEFQIDDQRLLKFSIMPFWTLPLVETKFPLYFGLGAGLGIFFQQVEQESNLSFDYHLVMGIRVPNLLENVGPVIEFGLKNHLHLLSDGQLNATALTVGAIFSF